MNGERVLIAGGAGFVGANLAHRLLSSGTKVRILDDLSRPGVERNLAWLQASHGALLEHARGDVRDEAAVARAASGASAIFHCAARVAATTSPVDPATDFEVNARGTLNLLEAARREDPPPFVLFTSTSEVYGALHDVALVDVGARYVPIDPALRRGVSEALGLASRSPHGCSKGAAEQYVLGWARAYGVPTAVFRLGCTYGPRQLGAGDEGWVSHLLVQAMSRRPVTLRGDGKQVRDVLFVEDLLDALLLARAHAREVAGRAFNVGGGCGNTVSQLELLDLVADLEGCRPRVAFEGWRVGDPRWYVSNPAAFSALTGWAPRTSVREGVTRLHAWLGEARRAPRAAEAAGASP